MHLDGEKMKEFSKDLNKIIDNYDSSDDYSYVNLLYKMAETRKTADNDYKSYIKKGKNKDVEPFKEEMKVSFSF